MPSNDAVTARPRCAAALALLLATAALHGQSFDVASVKRSGADNPDGSMFDYGNGRLRVTNSTLRGLIESAYDVRDFQVAGGPGWITMDRFDVIGRNGPGDAAVARAEGMQATRVKLQHLLADRFTLVVHHETRELQEYALVIDRKGLKIQTDAPSDATRTQSGIQSNCGHMTATRATPASLAFTLSRRVRRPVVDRTGLTGTYSFQLDWSSDVVPCTDAPSDGPSIFTALQERLGLKLESIKGPVDTIVVDHAEQPSAD